MIGPLRPLVWVGRSRADYRRFPVPVKKSMGYAIYRAQLGKKHRTAKPLKGFGGAGVLEVVQDFDGNAFRAVYTVKLEGNVYVLHAFQKKSQKTLSTDLNLAKSRLQMLLIRKRS